MNHYLYKAVDTSGNIVKGVVEGLDITAVRKSLTAGGLYVLSVKGSSRLVKTIQDKRNAWKIKRRDIIEFASNLSIMLHAGVPLLAALEDIINTMVNVSMKSALIDIKKNTEMGVRFSDALNLQKTAFPDIMIRLARVGEETGRLDQSFSEVATHLQKLEDLSATVKRALIYPAFSLFTTGAALVFWLAYVLPKIMQVIIGMGVKMPLLTKILYEVSKITERFWYFLIILPILVIIVIQLLKVNEYTKYYWDLTKIKLPLVRLLLLNRLLALLAEQLRLLISAGITIDRAFDVAADVMGNEVFKRAIMNVKKDITAGKKISDSMATENIFPPLFVRMVSVGESSGNLDQQFGFLAGHYYKIVDDISEKIGKMIEPILMIILGLMMGLMIAGVLLPMYDVFTKIK